MDFVGANETAAIGSDRIANNSRHPKFVQVEQRGRERENREIARKRWAGKSSEWIVCHSQIKGKMLNISE